MSNIYNIKKLVDELNNYRDAYYNKQQPLISDYEYDELFDKLEKIEQDSGIVLSNSPTCTVGYEVKSKLEKIKHSHPMLSLAKTKLEKDLLDFRQHKDCLLSCKMDGLTVLLTYENGSLIQAETRGNGEEGEIITHNARMFENIPLTIPFTSHFEIEGEAIIKINDFKQINECLPEGVEKYRNSRNLVSGSVRQLDNKVAKNRHIRFVAWKVPTECGKPSNSFLKRLFFAEDLGFEIVPFYTVLPEDTEQDLHILISKLKSEATELNYPIDGLVMTYNDIDYGKDLGMTGHHPKHSIAYKFYDDEFETKLINIEYSIGKTGVLTPVAIFEPTEIDGTFVERASLSNLSILTNTLAIPYVGQTIWVTKRNQIIPKVERALKDYAFHDNCKILEIPSVCPVCGGKTAITGDSDTKMLICTNPECAGKLVSKFVHFCSKNAINIEGLSEATLNKFIDLGWLEAYKDIYSLQDRHKTAIMQLPGFGVTSATKIFDAIEKSKITTLDRFLYALNIPLIGQAASKSLSNQFNGNFDLFWSAYLNHFDFTELTDFGSSANNSIYKFLDSNNNMVYDLAQIFIFKELGIVEDKLSNKTYVITGSLNIFANRDELKVKIESLGGKVAGSVSKNTDYLINNDTTSNSSKNKKAKELSIPIISEQDFIDSIN